MSNFLIRIDISKMDLSKFFAGKNGAKYVDLVGWENRTVGEYGDTHCIKVNLSREEREAGKKAKIIGNMKPMQRAVGQSERPASAPKDAGYVGRTKDDADQDIPF